MSVPSVVFEEHRSNCWRENVTEKRSKKTPSSVSTEDSAEARNTAAEYRSTNLFLFVGVFP